MSGKFNEFISLFVGDPDAPPCGTDQGWVKAETAAGPRGLDFFNRALDSRKDELAGRAAFLGSGFTDTTVKVAGQVDRGADRGSLHLLIMSERLK
jgi:hypothetical protein